MADLRLTFLGTSSAAPTPGRGLPSIAVQREGELIIMDCGEGAQRRILGEGLGLNKDTTVLITHLHGDHVNGLESFGFSVVQAGNAADAFEIVSRGGIDLVLSDIEMPKENGLALLRRIKSHDPDIDVIMVTGVVDFETGISYSTNAGNLRLEMADFLDERRPAASASKPNVATEMEIER